MKRHKDVASLQNLINLRQKNVKLANRCENLDSDVLSSNGQSAGSMKRTTAFINKIKSGMINSQLDSIMGDVVDLKLDRYLSEVVNAIVESKINTNKDLNACINVACLLHEKYVEFKKSMAEALMKIIETLASTNIVTNNPVHSSNAVQQKKEKEVTSSLVQQKLALRLLMEFYLVGIVSDPPKGLILPRALNILCLDEKSFLNNSSIIVSFCQDYGLFFFSTPCNGSNNSASNEELLPYIKALIPPSVAVTVNNILKIYYKWTKNALESSQKLIKQTSISNYEYYIAVGDITCERRNQYQKTHSEYLKVLEVAKELSKCFNFEEPVGLLCKTIAPGIGIPQEEPLHSNIEKQTHVNIWENNGVKSFYENLVTLPNEPQIHCTADNEEISHDADDTNQNAYKSKLELLFAKLHDMVAPECVDSVAIEFMSLNSKFARKKLIKALFSVPRNRIDLIPLYARLTATLNQVLPTVGADVVLILKNYVSNYIKNKNKGSVGDKVKYIRFMGELVKFRIVPEHQALHCINMLLDDFRLLNIDLLCIFLETCGRFLYGMPGTTGSRTANVLEIMRKKTEYSINHRHEIMIESAYYNCCPPEQPHIERKKDNAIMLYVKHLLLSNLSVRNVEKIIKKLRKFDWNNKEVVVCIKTCFMMINDLKYTNLNVFAYILHALMKYYPSFVIEVIDGIFEQVELGLEQNLCNKNQHRLLTVRLLVELYNYKLIQSNEIFNTLYNILSYGYVNNLFTPNNPIPLDSFNDLFRVRLCCTILSYCGTYFKTGKAKSRMECFMTFLQMYIFCKRPPPPDIHIVLNEIFECYCPQLPRFSSYIEASQYLLKLNDEIPMEICPQLKELCTNLAVEIVALNSKTSDGDKNGCSNTVTINTNASTSETDEELENSAIDHFNNEYEKLVGGRDSLTPFDCNIHKSPIVADGSSDTPMFDGLNVKGKIAFLTLDKSINMRKFHTFSITKNGLVSCNSSDLSDIDNI